MTIHKYHAEFKFFNPKKNNYLNDNMGKKNNQVSCWYNLFDPQNKPT